MQLPVFQTFHLTHSRALRETMSGAPRARSRDSADRWALSKTCVGGKCQCVISDPGIDGTRTGPSRMDENELP